jgi:endosialidase-like protein
MRLGTPSLQTRAFMAGVAGVPLNGSHVVISSSGQLGVVGSSARYKRDVEDMRERSAGVHQLRPVTFRYKTDEEQRRQYGLIAEEVAKVYPELVVQAAGGRIESVQYLELIPMLLNEVQHQQQKLDAQAQQLTTQAQQLTTQGQQLAELQAQNARLEAVVVQQHAALAARLEQLEQGAHRVTTVSTR